MAAAWDRIEVEAAPAHPRRALRHAWTALAVATVAALSWPLSQWWASWSGPEWWGLGIWIGLAVAALLFFVTPIALLTAAAWFLIAWRRAARQHAAP